MTFKFYFSIRGYELDSFGHVNNAVYFNYFEHARWEFFKEIDMYDYFIEKKLFGIVTEAKIRYLHELRLFDDAVVNTNVKLDGNFIIAAQKIFLCKENRPVARAKFKLLLVDEERIPYDVPQKFVEIIEGFDKE